MLFSLYPYAVWLSSRSLAYWWATLRALFGWQIYARTGQFGDGREERCISYVLANAPQGKPEAALAAFEHYSETISWLCNVGKDKGAVISEIVKARAPLRVIELGTHLGYGAVSLAISMPSEGSVLVTVETSAANASLARQFIAHAGLTDKISVIDGSVSGGELLEYLKTEASGEAEGATVAPFDLAFIDHDKTAYLMDLKYMLKESLVVKGSVLVADNILFPGAPDYRKFVKSQPEVFETTEHFGHVEHLPFIKDCITVSTML